MLFLVCHPEPVTLSKFVDNMKTSSSLNRISFRKTKCSELKLQKKIVPLFRADLILHFI